MSTVPSEIGAFGAEGIRDLVRRAVARMPMASYVDSEPPIAWEILASGGWDQVGLLSDGEGASLRDLVEVARAWGWGCIPQPLVPTLLAKRHSAAAGAHEGPVTYALPLPRSDRAFIPFGQVERIALLAGVGVGADELASVPPGDADQLALGWRGITADIEPNLSAEAARETAVVLAAEVSGGAERLVAESLTFVAQREQFGRPVGSFQAVKHHLADAAIAAEEAETALIWASARDAEVYRGARFAVERSIDIAEIAIQVHGGLGFTWEMGLHFPLRQMMVARDIVVALEESSPADS